jgi:hypothetical protein
MARHDLAFAAMFAIIALATWVYCNSTTLP